MNEETLHLVVIDDSSNDTETVSNILRNAGHAVRTTRVEDGDDLRKALDALPCDLILSKIAIAFFSAVEAVAIVRDLKLDVPVIALVNVQDRQPLEEALQAGVRDAVPLTDSFRLVHAVMRESSDVARRRRLKTCELLLDEANKRAQGLVDTSRDAIAYVHEGMHVYVNESYLELFGYSDSLELEGMPLMNLIAPADHGKFKEILRRLDQPSSVEVHGVKSDAGEFSITLEFSPTHYEGEACTQVIIRNQTMSKEFEQKLDSLSKQDLLTGLYNRQYFLDTLDKAVGNKGTHGTVLYLTPDRFRAVRDEIGIAASDMLIADLAGILQKTLASPQALLARFESYAFTVILSGSGVEQAEKIGRVLLKRIAEHVADVAGRSVSVSASIGIAAYNESTANAQEVLIRADKARRQAADEGGNALRTYNPAAEEMAANERALIWSRKLKIALRDNAFFLAFQPMVSLQGDKSENYEVYLRMVDEGKEINPAEFIAAAGEAGLMAAIDRWVLHNTMRKLIELRRAGRNTTLFVNVSDASLKDPNLLTWLRELLKAARMDGGSLVIEISEGSAQANIRNAKLLFDGLQQLRIRTAVDHFGAAANSNHLLRHIRPNYLKLDGSLMENFARDRDQQNRIKDLASLAKSVNALAVAEFVEDAGTLAALWSCGVDYIQGYFLARPGRELNYDFASG